MEIETNENFKRCPRCGLDKNRSEFYPRNRKNPNDLFSRCKPCAIEAAAESQIRRREKDPTAFLKRQAEVSRKHTYQKYGITQEQVNEMGESQNWCCYICNRDISKKYHLDHNHKTMSARGLLCSRCNLALGLFEESISSLLKAIFYLFKYKAKERRR